MIWALVIAGGLFFGMLGLQELGRRVGARRLARDPDSRLGGGAVDGAVLGLLGLLVAFAFSGAATRFDARRSLVTEEANAIGTAWLRIDVLPAGAQPRMRDLFRRYLDSRLEAYRLVPDLAAVRKELDRSAVLQQEIWTGAVAGSQSAGTTAAAMLLLPALNQMIDITTTRTMAAEMHPPPVLFAMLAIVAFVCAFLAGYGSANVRPRTLLHSIAFAAVVSVTVYVIIDLEYPRLGLIRVDAVDHVLAELRRSMG
jgi:hypothetical protein